MLALRGDDDGREMEDMIVIHDESAWAAKTPPWKKMPNGTLVVVVDPTASGSTGDGAKIIVYLCGRVTGGKVLSWRRV